MSKLTAVVVVVANGRARAGDFAWIWGPLSTARAVFQVRCIRPGVPRELWRAQLPRSSLRVAQRPDRDAFFTLVVEREFGALVQTLTEIFARIDPLALVDGDAPRDEYRPEAETILLCMTTRTVAALTRLIARECNLWFGRDPHGPFPRDRELARALVRALHERPSPRRA
ncbi:MAG: hypothetical protein Q8L14_18010 [Myxococcales bacterium]|nr:hypothetical protein [Myxococcales bacterium]